MEAILQSIQQELMRAKQIIPQRPCNQNLEIEFIKEIGLYLHQTFVIDDFNILVIRKLIDYFNGNPDGEYDIYKGLIIRGNIGVGKSTLFRIFKLYTSHIPILNSFQLISCREVVQNICGKGMEALNRYTYNSDTGKERANPIDYGFDDFGSEILTAKYYGSEINPFYEIIMARYDLFQSYGTKTHLTTNFSPSKIEELYGDRLRSRMKEMFNDVILEGEDRRKSS